MLVEQELVGRAEILEKPDLLWDRPDLDRLYARLEDEYEIRERQSALDVKLGVVTRAAQHDARAVARRKRSLNVEYYILAPHPVRGRARDPPDAALSGQS